MTDYAGWATADFLDLIRAKTTTELLAMLEGDDRLTHVQRVSIHREIKARTI